jgi:hypothetical protein
MEKKYQAWGAKPEGTGNKARTMAIARGAKAFHTGIVALTSGWPLGIATLPLEAEDWVTRLMVVSPISFLSNRFGSQNLISSHPVQ